MIKEIHEQPDVMRGFAASQADAVSDLVRDIIDRGITFVMAAARGTSDHAAIYGKYLLEVKNSLPVGLADCSTVTQYGARLNLSNALVIGVSQSGEAADVAAFLEQASENGALTAAVTNEPGSKLTKAADHTILCSAGKELSVAATKTYTATMAAFYMISGLLAGDENCAMELSACADQLQCALKLDDVISGWAVPGAVVTGDCVVSRGFNYCNALETALKITETSGVGVRGYSAADFLHGPVTSVGGGNTCVLIAPPGRIYDDMFQLLRRLKGRGVRTVVVSAGDDILSEADVAVRLEASVEEELSPLVYAVPGQFMAYHLALACGRDPDNPDGLSKVTVTR